MKNHFLSKLATAALFTLSMSLMTSCSKDASKAPGQNKKGSTTTTTTTTSPTAGTTATSTTQFNVSYTNRSNAIYGFTHANQDYSNAIYWDAFSSNIEGGRLKTTLAKNVVGPSGGVMSRMNVPAHNQYELQFDMMFDNNFDWSAGGKVGFGLLIGDGFTGGGLSTSGTGGSARLMWEKNNSGRVYLKPYIYHKDQPGTWGDSRGKTFPATGNIQQGVSYTVKMLVKSNTGSNTDGRIQMTINGTLVLDEVIRWTTDDTKRLINKVCFENFRGGSESYWQSSTDGHIYFNNVSLKAIN